MLLNLPNILTLSRIAAIPVILVFMVFNYGWAAWTAWAIFTLACITDYLDGWLARTYAQESPIGKFLDPIADKLLIGALLLMMASTNRLVAWAVPAAIIILMREILVSGLREYLAGLKANVSIPVSRLAKWKTVIQMIALGTLIVGIHGPWFTTPWLHIGAAGLWIAAGITVLTGWDYMKIGLQHMNAPDA